MFLTPIPAFMPTPAAGRTYATWNPSDKGTNVSLDTGNLRAFSNLGGTWGSVRSTQGKSTGKWYWELTFFKDTGGAPIGTGSCLFGIADSGASVGTYLGGSAKGAAAQTTAAYNGLLNGVTGDTGATCTIAQSDVYSFAFDADAGKLWVARNGTWVTVAPSGADVWSGMSTGGPWYPSVSVNEFSGGLETYITANFGASAFSYTVPAGFNSGVYV